MKIKHQKVHHEMKSSPSFARGKTEFRSRGAHCSGCQFEGEANIRLAARALILPLSGFLLAAVLADSLFAVEIGIACSAVLGLLLGIRFNRILVDIGPDMRVGTEGLKE